MLSPHAAKNKDARSAQTASFQHRHFAAIAAIIASMRKQGWNEQIIFHLADRFADELAATNPRFDRKRFLAACEPEEEEESVR